MKSLFYIVFGASIFALASEVAHCIPPIKDLPQKNPLVSNEFTNSIGMKFVWIPPGDFVIGSPKEEAERQKHRRNSARGRADQRVLHGRVHRDAGAMGGDNGP